MPRNAVAYLVEIQETCQFLIDRTAAMTLQEYLADKTVRLAVERCFITIGEAVNQLYRHHPAVGAAFMDRSGIVAFRNIIVHEYWAIDDEDVWSTLISKVPQLNAQVELMLKSLP